MAYHYGIENTERRCEVFGGALCLAPSAQRWLPDLTALVDPS